MGTGSGVAVGSGSSGGSSSAEGCSSSGSAETSALSSVTVASVAGSLADVPVAAKAETGSTVTSMRILSSIARALFSFSAVPYMNRTVRSWIFQEASAVAGPIP